MCIHTYTLIVGRSHYIFIYIYIAILLTLWLIGHQNMFRIIKVGGPPVLLQPPPTASIFRPHDTRSDNSKFTN